MIHAPLMSRLLLLTAFILGTLAGEIIELEEFNFDYWIGNGKPALVEFWAPWCDHCKKLEPTYKELPSVFDHVSDQIVFATVNSDALGSMSLLEKHGIKGLPTIRWFDANGDSEEYDPEAERGLSDLAAFVTRKSGFKSTLKGAPSPQHQSQQPPTIVTKQLTADTFDKIVNDPEKDVLVSFTATWCGHCQALKPIYDLVAWNFRTEEHVVLANLDAASDPQNALASKYNISGYPILKLFSKRGLYEGPIDYELPRDEEHLVQFLNEHTGTQRIVGGGVTDQAGRTGPLDQLASQFMSASSSARAYIYKQAKTAALSAGKAGKQYLRIMEKLVDGKNDVYLKQEKKRLVGLLEKGTLASEKLEEIKIRTNILGAFVSRAERKVAEGIRIEPVTSESEISRGKDEL